MSAEPPDRPGVAALVEELRVRRHAKTGLAGGIAVAGLVFLLFAYLPGTDESILFWAALAFVLASAVAGLVTTVLVGLAAYRRTQELAEGEAGGGGPSPTTVAVLVGVLGWVVVPVAVGVLLSRPTPGVRLLTALATGGFVALAVGGLAVRVAVALSVTHRWRPGLAAVGAVAYTALLAVAGVGCPSGGACLGTPDALVAAVVGLDPAAVSIGYLAVVGVGGPLVGAGLAARGAAPPLGVAAGVVAAIATLPLVAATSGDPAVVRSTALYLPVVLGALGGIGAAAVLTAGSPERSPER